MFRKNGWAKRAKLQLKDKEDTQKKKFLKMQIPTSEQIEKQVSVEVDNQLNQKSVWVCSEKTFLKEKQEEKEKGVSKQDR